MEDQGWLAWFIISVLRNRKITIYGSGKQVRDMLYVEDLVRAYDLAARKIKVTKGEIYNIGGGKKNSLSIWKQCRPVLESLFEKKIRFTTARERPGDQNIFIADIRKCKKDFGREPKVGSQKGIKLLYDWIGENKSLFIES